MAGFDVIADLLSATRRRLSVLHAACGASEATAVAAGGLLVAALLTFVTSAAVLRPIALALGLGGIGWAAWRHGWRPRRSLSGMDAIARLIETRSGVDGLLTAVQLRRDLDNPERLRAMSGPLAQAAIERASDRVRDVEAIEIVPSSPVKPRVLALLMVGLAWSLAFATAPHSLRLGLARLAAASGVSPADTLTEEVEEALAGDLTLHYRFPEYSGLPDRKVEGAWGEIQALKGTVVSIGARAFEPVDSGSIIVGHEEGVDAEPEDLPLTIEAGRSVSGELTVTHSGRWRFAFVSPGGRRAEEGSGRRIEVVADAPPRVEMLTPDVDQDVEATALLPVSWRARDDYGISGHRLVWQIAGGGVDPQYIDLVDERGAGGEGGREAFGQHRLLLKTLDIQPGDTLAVYIEATDNNGVDGPSVGRSQVRMLRIRSSLDRHNEHMTQLRVLWDKILDHLADRLEAEPAVVRTEDFAAIRTNVDRLNEALAGLAAAASMLVTALGEDELARADLQDGLRSIRDAFERDMREEDKALERTFQARERGRLTAAGLGGLRTAGEKIVVDVENAVLRLDVLFADQSMQDLEDLTRQLVRSQERLRSLLEKYKAAPNEQTKQRIEREISRLKARIADIMRKLSELMKTVPMEHLNRGALQKGAAFKAMDLAKRLQAIQDALDRGDIDAAMAALEQLEAEMQALQSQLQDDRREREREQDTLMAELGAIREALKQVQQEQTQVSEETAAVDQAAADRRKEMLEDRLQEFLEEELAKVQALQEALREMPPDALDGRGREQHRRLQRHSERLAGALERHDLDVAKEIAQEADSVARKLQREVGWRLPGALSPFMAGSTAEGRQARRSADDSAALAREIKNDLEALLPKNGGGQGFDEAERKNLERLAGRQASLEREARQLQERMESLQKELPMEAGEMAQGFERAAEHMDRSGEELRGRAPRPSGRSQSEALGELGMLDERLERMMKPEKQGKPGEGEDGDGAKTHGGRRMDQERVDIEADKTSPEAFRRDILEAMKRRGPSAYEEQVRRYYRELVK